MIICGIFADGDVDRMVLSPVIEHGRRQIGVYLRIRAQLGQVAQVDEIVRPQVGVDFADDETVAGQGQGHFKGVAVLHLADGHGRAAAFFPHSPNDGLGPFMPGTVIDGRPQYLSQGLILFVDLGDLVETVSSMLGIPRRFSISWAARRASGLRMMLTLAWDMAL